MISYIYESSELIVYTLACNELSASGVPRLVLNID